MQILSKTIKGIIDYANFDREAFVAEIESVVGSRKRQTIAGQCWRLKLQRSALMNLKC